MKYILIILSLFSLSACASIVSGKNQTLTVETIPFTGAKCTVENDKGKWYVQSTPGTVSILRSGQDLSVVCEKELHTGAGHYQSSTKAMAFGNILAGGIIGGAIDAGTGAAYDYPYLIVVEMKEQTLAQAKADAEKAREESKKKKKTK